MVFLLLTTGCASGAVVHWTKYTNDRFGFSMTIPAALIPSREPDNGDGREFHSVDREFSVTAYSHFFVLDDESLDTFWRDEIGEFAATAHYKRKTRHWFVISGVKDGREYYHKCYSRGDQWVTLQVSYPPEKAGNYDPWVTRIEKEFLPFSPGRAGN